MKDLFQHTQISSTTICGISGTNSSLTFLRITLTKDLIEVSSCTEKNLNLYEIVTLNNEIGTVAGLGRWEIVKRFFILLITIFPFFLLWFANFIQKLRIRWLLMQYPLELRFPFIELVFESVDEWVDIAFIFEILS